MQQIHELLQGDSEYILSSLSDNLIDIIITSPPYNVAHNYDGYEDNKDFLDYIDSMKKIFTQCYRVLKNDGRICVNVPFAVKNRLSKEVCFLSIYITQILNEIGFSEFEFITWHKGKDIRHFQGNNTAWGSWKSPSNPSFRPLGEAILVFYKKNKAHKGDSINADISGDEFKEWTKNVWYFDKDKKQDFTNILCIGNNAKKDLHPAPYPEELVERLLKLYSYKNDIVLDPFNGTGTTTFVAQKLGRNFIGIELSKKYCEIARQRLKNSVCGRENIIIKSFCNQTAKLVNNDDSLNSINEFFPYKESFSPNLLRLLADKFSCKIESVLDVFCGVGSSFLDPQTKKCYGFDTNPFAINIAMAKLQKISKKDIQKAKNIVKNFNNTNIKHQMPPWMPFNKYANDNRFSVIMEFIESFKNLGSQTYHFVKYLILANLSSMLDYKRDGNGIKYRKSKIIDITSFLKDITLQALESKERFDKNNTKFYTFTISQVFQKIIYLL